MNLVAKNARISYLIFLPCCFHRRINWRMYYEQRQDVVIAHVAIDLPVAIDLHVVLPFTA